MNSLEYAKEQRDYFQRKMNEEWENGNDLLKEERRVRSLADEAYDQSRYEYEYGDRAEAKEQSELGEDYNTEADEYKKQFEESRRKHEIYRQRYLKYKKIVEDATFAEKTCTKCGKTFKYRTEWTHVPNLCESCRKEDPWLIKKCRKCGADIRYKSSWNNIPNYCDACKQGFSRSTKIFTDISEGIDLVRKEGYLIPDYLSIDEKKVISLDDHLDPLALKPNTAYVYKNNLYLTAKNGKIAYIDCWLKHVQSTDQIRKEHPEYRKAGLPGYDAGHFGLALGQHPSIAMPQDPTMNRYGIWRIFERDWVKLLDQGKRVRIRGVFVEGDVSPYWIIREEIDGEANEYTFTNDKTQS